MCNQSGVFITLFVLLKLLDFVGDGWFLYATIEEWLRYGSYTVNEIDLSEVDSPYCEEPAILQRKNNFNGENYLDFSVCLLAYIILASASLLSFPAIAALLVPPNTPAETFIAEEDDISIGYDFRMKESGGKRIVRYLASLVLILIHDLPLAALGTNMYAVLVAPDGQRCYTCGDTCRNLPFARGWSSNLVFPINRDYYWLILIGGKVMGILGTISVVLHLELQYRYQIHVLKVQRQEQLLRRHFGPSQNRSHGKKFLTWAGAFLLSFVLMILAVLLVFAPTFTIILLRMKEALALVPNSFNAAIVILCLICWSAWGLCLLTSVIGLYILCRRRAESC